MRKENLLLKPKSWLKEFFLREFQNWKKIKALYNLSECETRFEHKHVLPLLLRSYIHNTIEDEDTQYLDYLLKKYNLNYLDWCYKIPWLKREMRRLRRNGYTRDYQKRKKAITATRIRQRATRYAGQLHFNFNKQMPIGNTATRRNRKSA